MLLSNTTPLGISLPIESKVRGNVQLISEQTKFPFIKLISTPKANKVSNYKIQWREISLLKAKEINKGSR